LKVLPLQYIPPKGICYSLSQIPPTPIHGRPEVSEKVTLRVPDMSCGHCVSAVSTAVGEVAGVSDVAVDLDTKRVEVEGDGVDVATISEAIRGAGYEPEQL